MEIKSYICERVLIEDLFDLPICHVGKGSAVIPLSSMRLNGVAIELKE
jgi:hypothetical protein